MKRNTNIETAVATPTRKLTKLAVGAAVAVCLFGATAGPALADSGADPLGGCIKQPHIVCAF